MSIFSNTGSFFGLDIGTTALRVVQLQGKGHPRELVRYAYVPVDPKVVTSDAKADQQKLGQAVKDLVVKAGLTTKNVAVGLPSQRVFTTVVDIERLSPTDLSKAIRLQADSIVPTPLAESRMEWAQIGDSPVDKAKVEVLISSATNDFIESRLDMLEAIGLNVIAFEPESFALSRSLMPAGGVGTDMIIDIGNQGTDIIILTNGAPRLTRALPTGSAAIVRSAMQNLNVDEKQAGQFVFKFGVSRDKLEGQVYQAIIGTVDILITEIEKSIKFFTARYANVKIDRVIVTGAAASLPEFPLYIANKFGVNVEIGNAWRNVAFPQTYQNDLMALSNQFGVAVGLAEREE